MSWLAVALATSLASGPARPPDPVLSWSGRVVTTDWLHLGLRPAAFLDNEANGGIEAGVGATVQVTLRTPW